MKKPEHGREQRCSLIELPRTGVGGLLKTGICSLLLHIALIVSLVLILKTGSTKGGSSIYRVTLQPFLSQNNFRLDPIRGLSSYLPFLEKDQIQKEEEETREKIKEEPVKEHEQLSRHAQEEEAVEKPIPLPMGEESTLNADSNLQEEDNHPVVLIPPQLREQYKNITSDGPSGGGIGGSGWGNSDEGSGTGQGGTGTGGFGSGLALWEGDSGSRGIARGPGRGQGGSGWGGPGNGGTDGSHPRYAHNPRPVYPLEAREKGYQGEVLLRVEVLPSGRVGQIELKRSSGHEVLDQSALTAVKKWKFIPARRGEVAIPFWVNIPIKFQLL